MRPSLYETALFLERSNRFAEAFDVFSACLEAHTEDEGDLRFHLGWCLENMSDKKEEVMLLYREAAEKTAIPLCRMNALFRTGWLLMHQNDFADAALYYRKAMDCSDTYKLKSDIYQHAVYWYAVCLETMSCFIEALEWYRRAQDLSPALDPESRYRQILCLNQIGAYGEALQMCRSFESPVPGDFPVDRYREIQLLVDRERQLLEASLADKFPGEHGGSSHHVS